MDEQIDQQKRFYAGYEPGSVLKLDDRYYYVEKGGNLVRVMSLHDLRPFAQCAKDANRASPYDLNASPARKRTNKDW